MSVEELASAILALPPNQRQELARWFEDHRHELLDPVVAAQVESAHRAELLRRRTEAEADPSRLESFEDSDVDRMFQDFTHARAQKAPSRPR